MCLLGYVAAEVCLQMGQAGSLCVTNVSVIFSHEAFKQPPLLPRGGILADDMGLGKTITTIALPRGGRPFKGAVNLTPR